MNRQAIRARYMAPMITKEKNRMARAKGWLTQVGPLTMEIATSCPKCEHEHIVESGPRACQECERQKHPGVCARPARDIGIRMRPDLLRRKRQSRVSFWRFPRGVPESVYRGSRLWVSIVEGRWEGYFKVGELNWETNEVAWGPSSWVEKAQQWPSHLSGMVQSPFLGSTPAGFYDLPYTFETPGSAASTGED